MEWILFVILCAVNIGFAWYACAHPDQYGNGKVLLRIGQLAAFGLFLVAGRQVLSFRLIPLSILLVLWLLIALGGVLMHRTHQKKKIIAGTILCVLALGIAMVPAFVITGYQGLQPTGEYEVAAASAILTDPDRLESFEQDGSHREVPVHLFYPRDCTEKVPLVVFSHGAFGWYQSNMSTYMELASHGYVVASLDHPYHSMFTKDSSGKMIPVSPEFMNSVMAINENPDADEAEIQNLSDQWLRLRTGDLNFVLDTLHQTIQEQIEIDPDIWMVSDQESLQKALALTDLEKIGVMGHSLGGAASVALGRIRQDIDAVVDLDGTMLSESRLNSAGQKEISIAPYPVSVLSLENQEHHEEGLALGEAYENSALIAHAADGYAAGIRRSAHMNFTDLPLYSPVLAGLLGVGDLDAKACLQQINALVLDFFECRLKDTRDFQVQEWYE